ncbi:MAG: hypothetical protein CML19_10025 [Pusillimonas sp.]|nr:hypothetical protein [Pusillimonas sp.]|tara:strand:- start:43254 stop:44447 length:1194 start_codon:yes stop_codon:yes gene_type:complete
MLVLNICILILVLIFGFNFKNNFKIFNNYDRSILNKLFLYHLLVSLVFYIIISTQGGDSTNYWFLTYDFRFYDFNDVLQVIYRGSATGSMLLINFIPAKILHLSFLTGNIIYATLGYIGFVFFYAIAKENIPHLSYVKSSKILGISIFPFFLFLPNFHFWSSGISKDTILFFCIALFVYSLKHFKRRFLGIVISILLSMAIRPHITLFLLISFGIASIIEGKMKGYQKVFLFMILIIGFATIFNYVLSFIKLESLDIATIESYTTKKSTGLSAHSGSGVDISGYPYPLKILTLIYRPLFFDSPNLLGFLASIENLILIIFTVKILLKKPFKAFRKAPVLLKGGLIFFVIGVCAFALILGNLGIMLRQKNMFMPLFLIFGWWVIYYGMERKNIIESKT